VIAQKLGVARETVRDWLTIITNGDSTNADNPKSGKRKRRPKPKPDARVKE
jgi:hypothetical protein